MGTDYNANLPRLPPAQSTQSEAESEEYIRVVWGTNINVADIINEFKDFLLFSKQTTVMNLKVKNPPLKARKLLPQDA